MKWNIHIVIFKSLKIFWLWFIMCIFKVLPSRKNGTQRTFLILKLRLRISWLKDWSLHLMLHLHHPLGMSLILLLIIVDIIAMKSYVAAFFTHYKNTFFTPFLCFFLKFPYSLIFNINLKNWFVYSLWNFVIVESLIFSI